MNSTEHVTDEMMRTTMKVVHRGFSENQFSIHNSPIGTHKILKNYLAWDHDQLSAHIENLIILREKIKRVYQNNDFKTTKAIKSNLSEERFLNKITQYIHDNIDNPELTVYAVMYEMNLSRTQLHRKIKATSGVSITAFIRTIRLNKAAQLLRQNADNISQIAYQTGFSDCSYFTKCFKQYYGVSPSTYLKQHF